MNFKRGAGVWHQNEMFDENLHHLHPITNNVIHIQSEQAGDGRLKRQRSCPSDKQKNCGDQKSLLK